MKVTLPANASIFFGMLFKIAAFDVFEVEDTVNYLLDLQPTDPIDANFEAIGFESIYFLNNLGPLMVVFLIYPVAVVIQVTLKVVVCGSKYLAYVDKFGQFLYYGSLIRIVFESNSLIAVCCLINMANLEWSNYGN